MQCGFKGCTSTNFEMAPVVFIDVDASDTPTFEIRGIGGDLLNRVCAKCASEVDGSDTEFDKAVRNFLGELQNKLSGDLELLPKVYPDGTRIDGNSVSTDA
ncbi:hypothetical protein O1L44_30290 [Streptomyces noursei]|uniref:hypothetical protein n=1 Tax=Streptomyces noursei TaxID=1971 RepID=UPI00081CC002|nr:hypothetical protein SNOUR_00160 [Streptomyces noursei ATCC 11455]ANZ21980.1 hypothetical protein SNOUR_43790 [Streptomyces noursei ATCC 11455]MCZ0996438.1 hypothetical protein [Streptomyces noursei]